MRCCSLLILSCAVTFLAQTVSTLEEVAAWRTINFGNFDPRDTVATGLTVTPDRFFISMPRLRENAPVTLAVTPRTEYPSVDAPLVPFPDWSWQSGHRNNCTGLVSVFRTRLDHCGRLWVLDSGTVNTSTRVCPARIYVFDPITAVTVHVFTVPPQLLRETSVLPFFDFEYDYSPRCDAMHVYISDALGYGLVVLDVMQNLFWRFEHPTFRNNPQFGTWQVAGETGGTTEDGIVGLAVVSVNGQNFLFYKAFAGLTIYAINTEALRTPSAIELPVMRVIDTTSQGVSMLAVQHSRLLFNPISETSLVELDTRTLRAREVIREPILLQFVVDMKEDQDGNIWLLTNRFQKFASNTYDPREINLRILLKRNQLPRFLDHNPFDFFGSSASYYKHF